MNDSKQETIATYNKSADAMAKRFDDVEDCRKHVDRALSYINKANPFVVELGCGTGRDAQYIVKKTDNYLGLDLSEELIKIAKVNVREAKFVVDDMESFEFPEGVDIVFAFASILHIDRDAVKILLDRAYAALNSGGIFYILTVDSEYRERKVNDEHGDRTYYDYNSELIESLAGDKYSTVYKESKKYPPDPQDWLSMALKKVG
jgi:SAM-dependent methyltransferase